MSNCYGNVCAQGSSQAVITGNVMLASSGYPSQLFLCSYHEFPLIIHLVDHCHSNVCAVSNPICTMVSLYPKCYPLSSQQQVCCQLTVTPVINGGSEQILLSAHPDIYPLPPLSNFVDRSFG